tara:strand:+ start:1559 stop:2398 length:840 start_codon:yes stop_codon:yes gene_type:complete
MIDLNNYRENIFQNYGIRECPYYGEDGVILKIFKEVGVSKNPYCVEFGELRVLGTTTRAYRIKFKARALYFSLSYDLRSWYLNLLDVIKLIFISRSFTYLKFFFNFPFKGFANKENIISIFKKNKVSKEDLDLLTIDLDCFDYYIIKEILDSGYRPKLFIVEYNPSYGLQKKCTYPNDVSFKTNNLRIYGASYAALDQLFRPIGYKLVFVSGFCNLFYLREDLIVNFKIADIAYEITDSKEKINAYIKKYCQKGFVPSWLNEPNLTEEDFSKLDFIKNP